MPEGLSGRQLAEKLQAEKPDLKVIFASGHSADIAGKEIQLRAGENFMQKPIRPDELLKIIRSCLDTTSQK
jgi:FixJ family two-component response regulator